MKEGGRDSGSWGWMVAMEGPRTQEKSFKLNSAQDLWEDKRDKDWKPLHGLENKKLISDFIGCCWGGNIQTIENWEYEASESREL